MGKIKMAVAGACVGVLSVIALGYGFFPTKMPSFQSLFQKESAENLGFFNPKTKTLENGLQIIVVENHRAPVVSHMLWYKVGSVNEVAGKTGIAHFLEHLMFGPTEKFPEKKHLWNKVQELGGQMNAFTGEEYTAYFQNVAKEYLADVMELEAARMTGVKFDQEFIDSERGVILEEYGYRVEQVPAQRLQNQKKAFLFKDHPYGVPVIGYKEDIQNLSLADIEGFYQTWYAPNNAVLIVSGDVVADDVFVLAQTYYGDLESKPVPAQIKRDVPVLTEDGAFDLKDPLVAVPEYTLTFQAPSQGSNDKQALALHLWVEIFEDPEWGFEKYFVKDLKMAEGFDASYQSVRRDVSNFDFTITPKEDVDVDAFKEKLFEKLKDYQEAGLTDEQFKKIKARFMAEIIMAQDGLMNAGYIFGFALSMGYDVAYVESFVQDLNNLQKADMMTAFTETFVDKRYVVAQLLPEDKAPVSPEGEPQILDPNAPQIVSQPVASEQGSVPVITVPIVEPNGAKPVEATPPVTPQAPATSILPTPTGVKQEGGNTNAPAK